MTNLANRTYEMYHVFLKVVSSNQYTHFLLIIVELPFVKKCTLRTYV